MTLFEGAKAGDIEETIIFPEPLTCVCLLLFWESNIRNGHYESVHDAPSFVFAEFHKLWTDKSLLQWLYI